MIYAYYRVSTDKQDIASQQFGVVDFAKSRGIAIDREIIDDGVSGCICANKRQLGKLLRQLLPGDSLIVPELSRLGRKTEDVLQTCRRLLKKQIRVYFVKNNIYLEDNPTSNLIITMFSAFSQLERDLIAQRTREALQKKKAEGVRLGRPPGAKNKHLKLDDKIDKLHKFLCVRGWSITKTARRLHVTRITLKNYLKTHNLNLD